MKFEKYSGILYAALIVLIVWGCSKDNLPRANFEMYKTGLVSAIPGDGEVLLTWDGSEEKQATEYAVSWTPNDSTVYVKEETVRITELQNGVEYMFSVQSVYGDQGRSAPNTVKAKPVSSRLEVTDYDVLAGDTKVLVKWTKPVSNELQGYLLKATPGNIEIAIENKDTESYVVEGLVNDVEYTFTLFTKYSKGNSEGLSKQATPGVIEPISVTSDFIFKGNALVFNYNPMYFLGTISSVSWDFGDGGTSSQASPSHTFNALGKFNVELTVTYTNSIVQKAVKEIKVSGLQWETLVNKDGTAGEIKASSPAIAVDGTIYISLSTNGDVYAFNPNGTVKWRFDAPTKGSYGGGPMIGSDGTVYAASQDGNLYAINPVTGTEKWRFNTGNDIRCFPALASDGTIYIATRNAPRKIYAVSSAGIEKWNYDIDDIAGAIAVGNNGNVYVGSGKTLYSLNSAGQKLWSAPVGVTEMGGIAIKGTTLYVGAKGGEGLYAFSTSGSLLWNFSISTDAYSPAVASDGTIYISCKKINSEGGGVVYAINPNGTQKWKFAAEGGGFNFGSPTLDENGVIYVASERGGASFSAVYAINPDGTQKWKLDKGSSGQMFSTPAIGDNGVLYLGDIGDATNQGRFFAVPVYAKPSDPNTTWGTRGGDNFRTARQ